MGHCCRGQSCNPTNCSTRHNRSPTLSQLAAAPLTCSMAAKRSSRKGAAGQAGWCATASRSLTSDSSSARKSRSLSALVARAAGSLQYGKCGVSRLVGGMVRLVDGKLGCQWRRGADGQHGQTNQVSCPFPQHAAPTPQLACQSTKSKSSLRRWPHPAKSQRIGLRSSMWLGHTCSLRTTQPIAAAGIPCSSLLRKQGRSPWPASPHTPAGQADGEEGRAFVVQFINGMPGRMALQLASIAIIPVHNSKSC